MFSLCCILLDRLVKQNAYWLKLIAIFWSTSYSFSDWALSPKDLVRKNIFLTSSSSLLYVFLFFFPTIHIRTKSDKKNTFSQHFFLHQNVKRKQTSSSRMSCSGRTEPMGQGMPSMSFIDSASYCTCLLTLRGTFSVGIMMLLLTTTPAQKVSLVIPKFL